MSVVEEKHVLTKLKFQIISAEGSEYRSLITVQQCLLCNKFKHTRLQKVMFTNMFVYITAAKFRVSNQECNNNKRKSTLILIRISSYMKRHCDPRLKH